MIVPYEKLHLYIVIYIDNFNMNIYTYEYEKRTKPFINNSLYILNDKESV